MEPITTNTSSSNFSSSAPSSPSSSSNSTSPSFKQKLKLRYQSSCFPSPFWKTNHHRRESLPASPHTPKLFRTSSIELRDKCKNFISRIGRAGSGCGDGHGNVPPHGRSHRRRHSIAADFRYDAMSYALNFDEGNPDSVESEFHLRSFSARLPESPKREVVIEVI